MRRVTSGTATHNIDELGRGASDLFVEIEYTIYPGEPMVMYERDGSGYPGSPPEVEHNAITVVEWNLHDCTRERDEHWAWPILDRIAEYVMDIDDADEACYEDANQGA